MSRAALLALVASGALASGGCVHERERRLGTVPEGWLAPPDGGGAPTPGRRADAGPGWAAGGGRSSAASSSVPLPPPTPVAPAPAGPIVVSTTGRDPGVRRAHAPIPATTSLEAMARERFLDAPTEVSAGRIVLYVPAAYAGEVVSEGTTIVRLRRLVLRGGEVKVVERTTSEDVQVSARGDVTFRSDQPASVLEERGLRGLLLRNDGYTPFP